MFRRSPFSRSLPLGPAAPTCETGAHPRSANPLKRKEQRLAPGVRPSSSRMKVMLAILGLSVSLWGNVPDDDTPATNVNSRYVIERVSISGWKNSLISNPLRNELDQEVGQKFDNSRLKSLADRIKKELHAPDV